MESFIVKEYFNNISSSFSSLFGGLQLTIDHILKAWKRRNNSYVDQKDYFTQDTGRVTLNYPDEKLEVPEIGRYKLHNEIDDCIVCDKCAKICPVDCIDIEAIKSPEVFGKTSDNTPKRLYAAKFDIDMAKCCFCGLCTTVCPTECLTMTNDYDFTEFDIRKHNFGFGNMTEVEIIEKRKQAEMAETAKQNVKTVESQAEGAEKPRIQVKPVFKPKFFKPSSQSPKEDDEGKDSAN